MNALTRASVGSDRSEDHAGRGAYLERYIEKTITHIEET